MVAVSHSLSPLESLTASERRELLGEALHLKVAQGQTVMRRGDTSRLTWLLSGEVEVRRSFFEREIVSATSATEDAVRRPLERLLEEASQLVALADCELLQLEREAVDTALASSTRGDYGVETLAESDLSEGYLISDAAVEVDWMARLLQSPLTQQLPARAIQQLLTRFTPREAVKGEFVVRRGTRADGLYVLVRGMAVVRTDREGPFGGREVELMPGDYFGEEALVADTLRNADVVMESDGVVAVLAPEDFDDLLRPSVLRRLDAAEARAWRAEGAILLDVRHPLEVRSQPLGEDARNLPVSSLRAALGRLERGRRYLVTPAGDCRAELALLLLQQAGFEAVLLPDTALGATLEEVDSGIRA